MGKEEARGEEAAAAPAAGAGGTTAARSLEERRHDEGDGSSRLAEWGREWNGKVEGEGGNGDY